MSVYVFIWFPSDSRGRRLKILHGRVLRIILYALFYVLFSTDSRGLDHGNFLQQLRKYEFVTPQLHAHGRWKRDTSTQTNSVSDEPIPYSDILTVSVRFFPFPHTVVYFASMNRIFFCGHIACICKNWFVN